MMMRRICSASCRSSGRTWHAAAGAAATWSWHSLRCLCTCVCVAAGVFSFDKTSSGVGEDSRVLLGPALLSGSLSLLRGSAADGVNRLRLRLPPTPLAPSVQPGLGSVGWSRGEADVARLMAMCAGAVGAGGRDARAGAACGSHLTSQDASSGGVLARSNVPRQNG
jgi:hypothetical protein